MMTLADKSADEVRAAHLLAEETAKTESREFLKKEFNGVDSCLCGFAWVTYVPEHRGNTRLGKIERRLVESIGFERDYTGKQWTLHNPARIPVQNVDVKLHGARAYADVFTKMTGVKIYTQSRLD